MGQQGQVERGGSRLRLGGRHQYMLSAALYGPLPTALVQRRLALLNSIDQTSNFNLKTMCIALAPQAPVCVYAANELVIRCECAS